MIENFFIHGCSHTAGCELKSWEDNKNCFDQDVGLTEIPAKCYYDSWANNVGRKLGILKIINNAVPGSSNDHILEHTIRFINEAKNKSNIFVIIGWTGADRLFLKSDDPGKPFVINRGVAGHYMFIPGLIGAKESRNSIPMKPEHEIMYKELLKTDWGKWTEIQYRMLLQHFTLQSFLEKHEVPYLFINMLFPFAIKTIKKDKRLLGLYKLLNIKRIYKGGAGDGCYYDRFYNDSSTVWNRNRHVGQEGQDIFATEVYKYIKENDLLLR